MLSDFFLSPSTPSKYTSKDGTFQNMLWRLGDSKLHLWWKQHSTEAAHHYRCLSTNSMIWCFFIWNTKNKTANIKNLLWKHYVGYFLPYHQQGGRILLPIRGVSLLLIQQFYYQSINHVLTSIILIIHSNSISIFCITNCVKHPLKISSTWSFFPFQCLYASIYFVEQMFP